MTPRSSNGFTLCRRKVEATAALLKETKVDLTAAIDSLRIEIEVIKTHETVSSGIYQNLSETQRRSDPSD